MNLLDLGILILLFLVTVRGYFRGLFQELAVLVGLVGGLLVAARMYLDVAALLLPLVKSLYWAQGLAFALVLVVFYWGVRLLSYVLQRLLYHLYLDVVDRLLGAFFALIKGALILGFALLLVGIVIPKDNRLLKGSRARPILIQLARRTLDLLPPDFKERLKELLHTVPFPGEKKQAEAPEKVGPRLAGTREIQAVSVGWAPPPVVFRIANPVYVRTDYGNQRQFWRHRFSNLCRRRTKQATTFIRPRFADKCIILVGQYWGKGSLYRAARGRRYWRARHDLSLPHQVCQR